MCGIIHTLRTFSAQADSAADYWGHLKWCP